MNTTVDQHINTLKMEEKIMTVHELQRKLNNGEKVFILDVRPADQRNEWHIAGSTHADAYERLNAGDNAVLDTVTIPPLTPVVTVCAAGKTSLMAAKALQAKGIDSYSLEGGMKAWNYAWNTAELKVMDAMVIQIRRAAKGVLSYMVGSVNEALVIDAALEPEVYQKIANENGWRIRYVMDTHVHADYVSRTRELASATDAQHLMIDKANLDFDFIPIANGGQIKLGRVHLEFLHTPGHTWESTTFRLGEEAIFTGDTLFVDGFGRPDLKAAHAEVDAKAKALYQSLKKIFSLNPEAFVLPAHTSGAIPFDHKLIGDRIRNVRDAVRVAGLSESEFMAYSLSSVPPTPPNYLAIAAINRKGSAEGQVLADLEAGGNHCAIH